MDRKESLFLSLSLQLLWCRKYSLFSPNGNVSWFLDWRLWLMIRSLAELLAHWEEFAVTSLDHWPSPDSLHLNIFFQPHRVNAPQTTLTHSDHDACEQRFISRNGAGLLLSSYLRSVSHTNCKREILSGNVLSEAAASIFEGMRSLVSSPRSCK